MFEHMTFENILQQMLNRVPNTLDKREGSIIHNALAPAAVELQNMYINLDWLLNQGFADTAEREFLIKHCAERGLTPEPATKAVLEGRFNIDIPIGSRFSLDELNYIALEKISVGVFQMQCETPGIIGNQFLGKLIPIEYINGLASAELTAVLIPGEDEESTESIRSRYFDSLTSQAYGGNVADYKQKVELIPGVGGVKVLPVWNGGGTVKLIIIDSEYNVPSQALIDSVQEQIDPVAGEGLGIAPIGHTVTVAAVAQTVIDIGMTLTYQAGWDWAAVSQYVYDVIDAYFAELTANWADSGALVVRISQIETRILDLEGIVDIFGTTINGLAQNLILESDKIPVRGQVTAT